MTLCPKETIGVYQVARLLRTCKGSGVKKLSDHCSAVFSTDKRTSVKYDAWQPITKTIRPKKIHKPIPKVKVMDRVQLECTTGNLVLSLEKELAKYSAYLFKTHWQQQQLKRMKELIKP